MNHDFLIGSAQLQQAFESSRSSGGGSKGDTITRRSFIKRTGGATVATVVAWNFNSQRVGAAPLPYNAVSFRWILKCTDDPKSSNNNVHNPSDGGFGTTKQTPLDPPFLGDGGNCYLIANLSAVGPKKDDRASMMEVMGSLTGGTVIRGKYRAKFKPTGVPNESENILARVSVQVWINAQTGEVTYTPQDGGQQDHTTIQWSAGPSQGHVMNQAQFTVTGYVEHDFRSAYSESMSVEAKASFAKIWEVAATAQVVSDINNLGAVDCKPQDLEWTIRRVKQYFDADWNIVHEEDFPIDEKE